MSWQFERSEYRIPYPPSARGTFTLGTREVGLVDCSERGIRYFAEDTGIPEAGARVVGMVRLLSGKQAFPVQGTVVRTVDEEVAVCLDAPGLPMQAIFAEQRYLAQHFPARYGTSAGR